MATERPGPSWLLTGAFLAAALVVGGALGAMEINGVASPLDRIENLTLDWRFLLAGARPAPASVVIVAIDDEALSEARRRCAHARNDGAPRADAWRSFIPDRSRSISPSSTRETRTQTPNSPARSRPAPAVVAAIGDFDAVESVRTRSSRTRAVWRWRRSRPPFFGRSTRSAMRRKWGLPTFRPTRAACLATFR